MVLLMVLLRCKLSIPSIHEGLKASLHPLRDIGTQGYATVDGFSFQDIERRLTRVHRQKIL